MPKLEGLESWTPVGLEQLLATTCEERGTKLGNVAQPLRVAITGTTISPSIHESLAKLGKERTTARIVRCLSGR